ncbi:MAG: hypothetical protein M1829_005512 [Trizodia sp. TS-e1964]|nr:MAG: hypothetical protein M1829_005512 [Trizodia sp. TS-e1964]
MDQASSPPHLDLSSLEDPLKQLIIDLTAPSAGNALPDGVKESTFQPALNPSREPVQPRRMESISEDTTRPLPARVPFFMPLSWAGHQPSQERRFHVPNPPRMTIPPMLPQEIPPLVIDPALVGYITGGTPDPDLTKALSLGDFQVANTIHNWVYESRRKAQKILPYVYLGPSTILKDRAFLKKEGVTMLLSIRNTRSALARLLDGTKAAKELQIDYRSVDVMDNQELVAAFLGIVNIINEHLCSAYRHFNTEAPTTGLENKPATDQKRGKVFLYCETGNDRSACAAAAYVMTVYNLNVVSAVQMVQAQRFCSSFNDDTKNVLLSYAAILEAKRDVFFASQGSQGQAGIIPVAGQATTSEQSGLQPGTRSKRGFEEFEFGEKGDVAMEDDTLPATDYERFEGRQDIAPFIDRCA